jgi:protein-L-isoaspartate(D-aspartate) O-methyltransferase
MQNRNSRVPSPLYGRSAYIESVLSHFDEDELPESVARLWEERFEQQRRHMVQHQLVQRGIRDPRVLYAMTTVPRHRFVPAGERHWAYQDTALDLGHGQTISQPYIVAYMTEQAAIPRHGSVLEIGTGSGYQAAILSTLAQRVYSVEIVAELAQQARETLRSLGYDNVQVKHGNGYQGWAEHAPYDAIIVTAAPPHLPSRLIEQLPVGGRLVVPVGHPTQTIQIVTKTAEGVKTEQTLPVQFVPMVGAVGDRPNRWKPNAH